MAAVAVPVEIGVLIAAILLLVAAYYVATSLQRPLAAAVGQIPVVGGWMASNIESLFGAFIRGTVSAANAALGALTGSLDFLSWAWGRLVGNVVGIAAGVSALAVVLTTRTIPTAVAGATNYATYLFDQGIGVARTLAADAAAGAAAATANLTRYAESLYAQAVALTRSEVARVEVAVGVSEAHAIAAAEALVRAERDYATAQIGSSFAAAQALVNNAVGLAMNADAQLGRVIGGQIGQVAADAQAGIKTAEQQATAQNVATAAAAATSIGVVAAEVAAIRAMRCLKVCDQLGGLGEGLKMLELLGLVEFVAGATADPKGAAREFAAVVDPVAQEVGAAARVLVGLP